MHGFRITDKINIYNRLIHPAVVVLFKIDFIKMYVDLLKR